MADKVSCSPTADNAFGPVVRGCRGDFDFTLTFEQCFFAIAPSAAMLVLGGIRLYNLWFRRETHVYNTANALKWTKVAFLAIFAAFQLTLVIVWGIKSSLPARSYGIAAAALSFSASILMVQLSPLEHSRSLRPSNVLGVYLFFSLLFDAVILRTVWILPTFNAALRAINTAAFCIKGAILLLEAKSKRKHLIPTQDENRSPEETINFYAQSLFWWLNGLIMSGFKKILRPCDLYPIQQKYRTELLNQRFWSTWKKSSKRGKNVLLLIITRALGWHLMLPVIPRLFLLGLSFCQPLLLRKFLTYLDSLEQPSNMKVGYGFIGAYGLVYIGMAVSSSLYWQAVYSSLTILRGMLVAAIYDKTMSIDVTALRSDTKAVTLMGTDVERIVRGVQDMHELWANVVTIALATWLLKAELGLACIGPIIVTFLSVGATLYAATFTAQRQKRWMEAIEKRISIFDMISSVLGSMKSVHIMGLTRRVKDLVHHLRLDEISAARSYWVLGVYTSTIALIPQTISPVVTFGIFTADASRKDAVLDFDRLFTSLSLLLILTQPLFDLFHGVSGFASALGCFTRVQEYLLADHYQDTRNRIPGDQEEAISIGNGKFKWTPESEFCLSNISFNLLQAKHLFIIGPVASGKSTLLKVLLGEIPSLEGEVNVHDESIAYCDQTPWLRNATIKENIIGQSVFDSNLYRIALRTCALETDLQELKDGDHTKIGSKGVSLSSGQKHRIALARAVYSRKPIMFLDGVFSQLDSNVQRIIFANLFGSEGLFRQWRTTVVFATHDVHFLPFADLIVCLDDTGRQCEHGTFDQLKTQGGYVASLIESGRVNASITLPPVNLCMEDSVYKHQSAPSPSEQHQTNELKDNSRRLGDFATYGYYFASLGWTCAIIFAGLQMSYAFFMVFPIVWLEWWSDANTKHPNHQENGSYVGGYAGLQAATLLSAATLTWFVFSFYVMAQKAGLQLHTQMLIAVMRAPISLFQKTDLGAIVTRFSQDFQFIDSRLPLAIMGVVQNLFICVGEAGLIASASAWILVSYPVLITAVYLVQQYYLRTSRQLRLLDLEEKSPLYTQFLETLDGLSTVRGFRWQHSYIQNNYALVDNAQKPYYLLLMIQKWLALVLDLIVAALAVLLVGITVALRSRISIGFTGVALIQIISLTGFIKMMILFFTSMETSLGAVNRIMQFTNKTEKERTTGSEIIVPPNWPMFGQIILSNVSAVYHGEINDHPALHNITMHINPGEKIGICGRTGSGKTSLMLSLFSMIELRNGSISIDGLDLSTLRKDDVRSRMNAVPDDPFFFSGTIRENLDPAGACTNEQLFQALSKVGLSKLISPSTNSLDDAFRPADLSQGQKQMFALARAILRPCGKVVFLDEATSRTDRETGEILQKVIRQEFSDCTVVSIIHRVKDIIDWDRIAVLENGRLVEFDRPHNLLARKDSAFKRFIDAYGTENREGSSQEIQPVLT
ncbi:hypothetical protein M433DRAFT_64146 [Acidomyces richmondensis BFW]|nr:hypothetical protein M433DRAFT_64146 [Acidomyces richmondensis BFW]